MGREAEILWVNLQLANPKKLDSFFNLGVSKWGKDWRSRVWLTKKVI
jgi:hypothetical protein